MSSSLFNVKQWIFSGESSPAFKFSSTLFILLLNTLALLNFWHPELSLSISSSLHPSSLILFNLFILFVLISPSNKYLLLIVLLLISLTSFRFIQLFYPINLPIDIIFGSPYNESFLSLGTALGLTFIAVHRYLITKKGWSTFTLAYELAAFEFVLLALYSKFFAFNSNPFESAFSGLSTVSFAFLFILIIFSYQNSILQQKVNNTKYAKEIPFFTMMAIVFIYVCVEMAEETEGFFTLVSVLYYASAIILYVLFKQLTQPTLASHIFNFFKSPAVSKFDQIRDSIFIIILINLASYIQYQIVIPSSFPISFAEFSNFFPALVACILVFDKFLVASKKLKLFSVMVGFGLSSHFVPDRFLFFSIIQITVLYFPVKYISVLLKNNESMQGQILVDNSDFTYLYFRVLIYTTLVSFFVHYFGYIIYYTVSGEYSLNYLLPPTVHYALAFMLGCLMTLCVVAFIYLYEWKKMHCCSVFQGTMKAILLAFLLHGIISASPSSIAIQLLCLLSPFLFIFILRDDLTKIILIMLSTFIIFLNLDSYIVNISQYFSHNPVIASSFLSFYMIVVCTIYISTLIADRTVEENKSMVTKLRNSDPLTQANNRTALLNRKFESGLHTYIFILDIDFFKSVNDSYSHSDGDNYLRNFTKFLIDKYDYKNVFRLGGEEFAVLINRKRKLSVAQVKSIANNLVASARSVSITIGDVQVTRSVSVGICYYHRDYDLEECMQYADLALMHAKASGKNQWVFADTKFIKKSQQSGQMLTQEMVADALRDGKISFDAQPIVSANKASIFAFEALIRWRETEDGKSIPPLNFVRLLSYCKRNPSLRKLLYQKKIDLINSLRLEAEQYVSFNYLVEELAYEGAANLIAKSYKDVDISRIIIELSENNITERVNESILISELKKLRQKGFLIALDDYGVEASNLHRLINYPLDIVKLDMTMKRALRIKAMRLFVINTTKICSNLRLSLVIEGIETLEEAWYFASIGITFQQGYFWSKPLSKINKLRKQYLYAKIEARGIGMNYSMGTKTLRRLQKNIEHYDRLGERTVPYKLISELRSKLKMSGALMMFAFGDTMYNYFRINVENKKSSFSDTISQYIFRDPFHESLEIINTSSNVKSKNCPYVTGEIAKINYYFGMPIFVNGIMVATIELVDDMKRKRLSQEEKDYAERITLMIQSIIESYLVIDTVDDR